MHTNSIVFSNASLTTQFIHLFWIELQASTALAVLRQNTLLRHRYIEIMSFPPIIHRPES